MLVIRLARTGRNKYPTYRIVAAESARAATGRFVAVLGNYNPHTKDLVLRTDDIKKHLANGAQPSNTVVKLLQREKVELPAWVQLKTKAPKAVAAAEPSEAEVSAAEAAAPVEPAEAPADTAATAEAEERVGQVVGEIAAEATDDVPNIGGTETAASVEADTADAEAAQDAAAEAASDPS